DRGCCRIRTACGMPPWSKPSIAPATRPRSRSSPAPRPARRRATRCRGSRRWPATRRVRCGSRSRRRAGQLRSGVVSFAPRSGPGPLLSADVAVAVATCGRPDGLARCLELVTAGTAQPGELIVVDQAPSPGARRAVEACTAVPVRYVEQPRRGLSASRNLALSLATRPVLAVTDDDCAPDPGWVAAIADAVDRRPEPAAVTGPVLPLGPQPPGMHGVSFRDRADAVDFRAPAIPWATGSGANFAARTHALRAIGGWDERLGTGTPGRAAEDSDLLYRILRDGGTVRYEPAAVVRHEWQTWSRRLATRWSYGFGIGAMCGL